MSSDIYTQSFYSLFLLQSFSVQIIPIIGAGK